MPSQYVVPIIVALLAKYILGDWDEGYAWSVYDLSYWGLILCVSYAIVHIWGVYWKATSV